MAQWFEGVLSKQKVMSSNIQKKLVIFLHFEDMNYACFNLFLIHI